MINSKYTNFTLFIMSSFFMYFLSCQDVIKTLEEKRKAKSAVYYEQKKKLLVSLHITGCNNSRFLVVPDWYFNDYYHVICFCCFLTETPSTSSK